MWDDWTEIEQAQARADRQAQERLDAEIRRRGLRAVPEPPHEAPEPPQAPREPVAAAQVRVNPLPPLPPKPAPKPVDRSRGLRYVLEDLLDALKGPKL